MAITSLVISIASFLIAAFGAWLGWRSLAAAKRSATAADRSAIAAEGSRDAAVRQADATRDQLAIERQRFDQEQTPILEGSIRPRPGWRGGPQDTSHVLEVRVRGSRTLASLTLRIPAEAFIGRNKGLAGPMSQDFAYPRPGTTATIGPGNPATWDIVVTKDTPDSFTAVASCRDEYGKHWQDVQVEVLVTREA